MKPQSPLRGMLIALLVFLLSVFKGASNWAFAEDTAGETPGSQGRTLGLVLVSKRTRVSDDPADCPQGLAKSPQDYYLAGLSEAERTRLLRPENQRELFKKSTTLPDGTDICFHPEVDVPRDALRIFQGKIAAGLDLDGKDTVDDFVSPEGERGVDNQFYRVLGCVTPVRNKQFSEGMTNALLSGENTILIEITLHGDARKDAEVGVYTGIDPIVRDRNGKPIPYASYRVTDNNKWINRAHGRILNGVLITDPIDLRLRYQLNSLLTEFDLRQARLRLQLQSNGGARGVLAGYENIDTWFDLMRTYGGNLGSNLKFDCPTIYREMQKRADGGWDTELHRNTAISNGYEIEAIPAFLVKTPAGPNPGMHDDRLRAGSYD